jgi:NADH:ubiquinone oxidoreductase subunit B-like Fe-S oxidoreductase
VRPKEALIVMGPKKVEMAAGTRETHEWMLAPDHVIGVG